MKLYEVIWSEEGLERQFGVGVAEFHGLLVSILIVLSTMMSLNEITHFKFILFSHNQLLS